MEVSETSGVNTNNSAGAKTKESDAAGESNRNNSVEIPQISLPKGGGAISGMGEKLSADPVKGTDWFSIPIAMILGQSDFGLQLSLSYDSGAGNGFFWLRLWLR